MDKKDLKLELIYTYKKSKFEISEDIMLNTISLFGQTFMDKIKSLFNNCP